MKYACLIYFEEEGLNALSGPATRGSGAEKPCGTTSCG